MAKKIIIQTEHYLRLGRREEPYEEAIRDVLLTSARQTFAFEDITNIPWIEIDFAADIERANTVVLPQILAAKISHQTVPAGNREVEQTMTPTLLPALSPI